MSKKKKLTKTLAALSAAGCIIGSATPIALNAVELSKYSVVEAKYQAAKTEGSGENAQFSDYDIDIMVVTNPDYKGEAAPTLTYSKAFDEKAKEAGKTALLSENIDGKEYAFKDMNLNGEIDDYERWYLDAETRAQDLADALVAEGEDGIAKIAGLMLFSSHEGNSAAGLTDSQKDYLTNSYVRNITDAAGNDVEDSVRWVNAMQEYVEISDFNVPVDFSSDPRSTAGSGDLYSDNVSSGATDISKWPSNIGLAATFDTEHMYNFAKASSAEYRALGIVTALGPQIDLATEPRWLRVGGTFGENTKLSTDMAQAYVDGSQSTYVNGEDQGWGKDSINCMIKHFPGDGAGEGGRESHTRAGKYAVYPGGNFEEHLTPFAQGGLKLKGKTGAATAVMTSYSIGINADGSALGGERVGSAYSKSKMSILRDDLGFDGVVCTDWGVTSTPPEQLALGGLGMAWGMENATDNERHLAILDAGGDMFGGNNDNKPIVWSWQQMVDRDGEETANTRFATSAKRLLKLTMEPGLFENTYLNLDESLAEAGSKDKKDAGYQAQLESVVMLKNKDNTIKAAKDQAKDPKDMTVYIPKTYTAEQKGVFGDTPASWSDSMNIETAKSIYGTVLTDEIVDDKVVRPDLSNVDKVIVGMRSPNNGSLFNQSGMIVEDGKQKFYPLSLQYRPYTADGENVRKVSIAGDLNSDGTQQNRSYYGATSKIANEYDLTACLEAVEAAKAVNKDIPVVVALNANGPVIVSEFEDKVDAIVCGFSVSDSAVFDIINGKSEPKGLLPLQFPANMDTVEANKEDVAGDLVCYKDTQGNTYDVAYGLNWSGIIDDERVQTYNPDRPTTDTTTVTPTPTPDKPTTSVKTGDEINLNTTMLAGAVALVAGLTAYVTAKKRKAVK